MADHSKGLACDPPRGESLPRDHCRVGRVALPRGRSPTLPRRCGRRGAIGRPGPETQRRRRRALAGDAFSGRRATRRARPFFLGNERMGTRDPRCSPAVAGRRGRRTQPGGTVPRPRRRPPGSRNAGRYRPGQCQAVQPVAPAEPGKRRCAGARRLRARMYFFDACRWKVQGNRARQRECLDTPWPRSFTISRF